MATDMEVEKDVTTQLEGEKEGMLSEAVETESKNLMESEELSRLKDTVEPANDVSNVNDVEMTAAEDTVVKDGGGDIPAAVEGLVGKDGCGDIPVVAAEDFACKDGCGDIPAAAAEDFGVKDGSISLQLNSTSNYSRKIIFFVVTMSEFLRVFIHYILRFLSNMDKAISFVST